MIEPRQCLGFARDFIGETRVASRRVELERNRPLQSSIASAANCPVRSAAAQLCDLVAQSECRVATGTEVRDHDPKIRNGAALWHTDQSYESEPASATMLYSIRAPQSGGESGREGAMGRRIPGPDDPGRDCAGLRPEETRPQNAQNSELKQTTPTQSSPAVWS